MYRTIYVPETTFHVLVFLFMIIGNVIAFFLYSRRLKRKYGSDGLNPNDADSRRVEENLIEGKLKESEERYRSLVEMATSVIAVVQEEKLVYLNPEGLKMLGVRHLDQLPENFYLNFFPAEGWKGFSEKITNLASCDPKQYMESSMVCSDGTEVQLEISSNWIHYSGKLALLIVCRDMTERKQSQKAFQESEDRYRMLQESLDHFSQDLFKVMEITDLETRFILELKQVLKLDRLSIVEIDDQLNLYRNTKGTLQSQASILKGYHPESSIGELVIVGTGGYVKIGEINGRTILLTMEDHQQIAELLPPQRIWLQTISRYVSVLYENLFTIEDLANELEQRVQDKSTPRWILRLLFQLEEKERMRLSADLHDSVLQNLIIQYREMDSICLDQELPAKLKQEIQRVKQEMLETIQQIRVTCNYLRPPYLKEQGLIKAIESLLNNVRLHVDFTIDFNYTGLKHELKEEAILALYRITQELLANAQKHSQATKVELTISSMHGKIYYMYQDNGVGFDTEIQVNSFEHIGLSGMRKRLDSIGGEMELFSAIGKGVNVLITLPAEEEKVQPDTFLEVFE